MAAKEKRATDELNVALSGISSALSFARNSIPEGHDAMSAITRGEQYCEEAFSALLTIQFHAAKI